MTCFDPEYLNQPLEVIIEDKSIVFTKRPRDLKTLYELIQGTQESSTPNIIFEYSGNEGVKQLTNDLFLQEAYILHSNTKLVIGSRYQTTT